MKQLLLLLLFISNFALADDGSQQCGNHAARAWWDVQQYDLTVDFKDLKGKIAGRCSIISKVVNTPADTLQLDLDEHLFIREISMDAKKLRFTRQGSVCLVFYSFSDLLLKNETFEIQVYYEGQPPIAKNPPWEGGFILKKDAKKRPWMSVACQTEGASIWFPCKNYQGDEAKQVIERYIVPDNVMAIGNGRLTDQDLATFERKKTKVYTWVTKNPVNTYNITFYVGDYVHWTDTVDGENGPLSLDYYVLRQNRQKAKKHFKQVPGTIRCYESKFGPYPFYEDGYKIVEAPFLGMEHQSAIAYGNGYQMGYEGEDISGSGAGLLFDYIIVHESAHEWFGNNITAADRADNWIHEGFASYAETIYTECRFGRQKAFEYQRGKCRQISNSDILQGRYGNCDNSINDQYMKAAQVVHMVRVILNNDTLFWNLLRALNKHFYHQLIDSHDFEQYISQVSGIQLSDFFDQYVRNKEIPVLELRNNEKGELEYRYANCLSEFKMPVDVIIHSNPVRIFPSKNWSNSQLQVSDRSVGISDDFLIRIQCVDFK
jgi:aminopeptidase N